MYTFRTRTTHFRGLRSVFLQAQFVDFEDIGLETPMEFSARFLPFPTLTLQFGLAEASSRVELARVLYVFKRIFNVKPLVRRGRSGGYRLSADFSSIFAVRLLGFFMRLRFRTRTKFLRFFFTERSFDFCFLLFEPITFFPLIHPGFDYHDWSYPFEFLVRFNHLPGLQDSYLESTVHSVFNILIFAYANGLFYYCFPIATTFESRCLLPTAAL